MPKLKCEGWWEQAGFGRQPMNNLVIQFSSGELSGSGDDIVGPFVLSGRIEDDQILIRKQYLGQHSIDYQGTTHGEGVYFGDWSMHGFVGGKWSIHFRSVADDAATEITRVDRHS